MKGKTYSLFGDEVSADKYYITIRSLIDALLRLCPDKEKLLMHVQRAGGSRPGRKNISSIDNGLISSIKAEAREKLSAYTTGVKGHLRSMSLGQRMDPVLRTKEPQYHLYMLEIELVNRMYRDEFKRCDYKFALLPHCLRDFRPDCASVPADVEEACMGCTDECFINLGGELMKKYDIHPYISVNMDLEGLFRKLRSEHPSIGALGVACVPELAQGMRLCIKLGIPPVGIPLNANRCARWMKEARESSFDIRELEELIK
ncbi:MAG: DUF116 domain-containing protein [Nitrospirota bacterium]|nr:MAG: DUF116 domain-containing protein [Nitrospirota bacterium]